jgi:hypothetical protein
VLHEVTGRHLTLAFAVGDQAAGETEAEPSEQPTTEEEFLSLVKDTFDARELGDSQ